MSRNIKITRLARDVGRSPQDVLKTLSRLGFERYKLANQVLPVAVAEQVRRIFKESSTPEQAPAPKTAAKPAPDPGAGVADEFQTLMARSGVQPLGEAPRPRPRERPSRVNPRQPRPPSREEEAPPETARAPAEVPPAPEGPPGPGAPPPATENQPNGRPAPALPVVEETALRGEVEALRQRLTLARQEKSLLAGRLAGLEAEVSSLSDVASSLRTRLDGGQQKTASVMGLLQERGFRGLDEASLALRRLLEHHLLDVSLPLLETSDPIRLRALLRERVCLWCGDDRCSAPPGMVAVTVARSRCEVCGGGSVAQSLRTLSDACLLSGFTRLLWVGGRSRLLRLLEEQLDHRLELVMVAGQQLRPPDVVDADLGWAQVVVIWQTEDLPPSVEEAYGRDQRFTVVICAPSLAGAAAEAADGISSIDVEAVLQR